MPSTPDDWAAYQQAYADLLNISAERVEHAENARVAYRKALVAQRDQWRRGNVSGFEAVTIGENVNIALTAFRDAGELMREADHAINHFFGR